MNNPLLVASNIHCQIGKKNILQGVTFELLAGNLLCIVGANGAGKSSLIKIISGERPPNRGSIRFLDKPVSSYSIKNLAQHRAMLAQNSSITSPFMAIEIVQMGRYPFTAKELKKQTDAIVEEVMQLTGVWDLRNQLYSQLSGGEKQRVQLARVLSQIWHHTQACSPSLLLLDEPVNALDLHYQYQLMTLTEELKNKGIGIIAIVHDLGLASRYADTVIMMHQGKIMASGKPTEVFTKANLHEAFTITPELVQAKEKGKSFPPTVPIILYP